jgi:hypothetical protein
MSWQHYPDAMPGESSFELWTADDLCTGLVTNYPDEAGDNYEACAILASGAPLELGRYATADEAKAVIENYWTRRAAKKGS